MPTNKEGDKLTQVPALPLVLHNDDKLVALHETKEFPFCGLSLVAHPECQIPLGNMDE